MNMIHLLPQDSTAVIVTEHRTEVLIDKKRVMLIDFKARELIIELPNVEGYEEMRKYREAVNSGFALSKLEYLYIWRTSDQHSSFPDNKWVIGIDANSRFSETNYFNNSNHCQVFEAYEEDFDNMIK